MNSAIKNFFILVYKIENKFGINYLSYDDFKKIESWIQYFSEEMIMLACDKTLSRRNIDREVLVKYTNGTMRKWANADLKTPDEVEKYEKEYWGSAGPEYGFVVGELNKQKDEITRNVSQVIEDSLDKHLGKNTNWNVTEAQDSNVYSFFHKGGEVYLKLPNKLTDEDLDEIKFKLFQKIYETQRIIPGSHLPDKFEKFEKIIWELYDEEDREIYAQIFLDARAYVKKISEKELTDCSLNRLYKGGIGRGKSFVLNCIGNEAKSLGLTVIKFSASTLFETILTYKFNYNKNVYTNILKELYSYDILIIDDLGSEIVNKAVIQSFQELLDERKTRKNPTVMATSLEYKEICEKYEEPVFSRIYSFSDKWHLPKGADLRVYLKTINRR